MSNPNPTHQQDNEQTILNDKINNLNISPNDRAENVTGIPAISNNNEKSDSVCLIVIGMAGSGKTTFIQRLVSELHTQQNVPYVVNLDPAVYKVPYPVNVDIRESVRFKQVMQKYKLGPNGAIVTCLNLFATKFDQVYDILNSRKDQHKHLIFDTPGQIEVFTWSASGSIITESLATLAPTVMVYVIDAEKSMNPTTFMSNMLHACSVMYRSQLPLVIVLNKIDIADYKKILGWIKDFELFEQAIDSYSNEENSPYVMNLVRSLNLVLDEFYCQLNCVGVSSLTGEGFKDFIYHIIPQAVNEFITTKPPSRTQPLSNSEPNSQPLKTNP